MTLIQLIQEHPLPWKYVSNFDDYYHGIQDANENWMIQLCIYEEDANWACIDWFLELGDWMDKNL